MTTDVITQRVVAVLARMGKHDVPLDADLVSDGILDSLDFLELVDALEAEFQVELDFSGLDPEQFTTIAGLVGALGRHGALQDLAPPAPGASGEGLDPAGSRRADASDLVLLCRTAMRAYAVDPLVRWLYPDDAAYEADGGLVFRYSMRRWLAWNETFVTPDVASYAAWVPPGRPPVSVAREPADGPLPNDLLARFRALGDVLLDHTPPEPHWYLAMIGTHPDWQGLGLGRRLLSLVFERTRDQGVGSYLETQTADNVDFYRRLGFEVRSEWDVPLDGPHMWGMWRPSDVQEPNL